MKKKIIIILYLLTLSIYGQEMNELRVVGRGEKQDGELIDRDVKDANGDVAAGLIIETDLDGLVYSPSLGLVKMNHLPSRDFLFLQHKEREIKILLTGYAPLQVILKDFGIKLEIGQTWKLKLTGDKKQDQIPINIITKPAGASIFIDGKDMGTDKAQLTTQGKHKLRVEMPGYITEEREIDVRQKNPPFDITLEAIQLAGVVIRKEPKQAKIYIDDVEEGETFFKYPGTYRLKLSLSGYLPIEKEITVVSDQKQNEFSFTLQKNTGYLILKVIPANAEILINKKPYSTGEIKLAPGKYQIELSKQGYNEQSEMINIEMGKKITKEYALVQKTGSLRFSVSPAEAVCKLSKNGTEYKTWKGLIQLTGIPVGDYDFDCSASGYVNTNKKIHITEDKYTVENIVLAEGADVSGNMVLVKGDTFTMGETGVAEPTHSVTLSDFYIGKYEVTLGEFKKFMESGSYNQTDAEKKGWSYVWTGTSYDKKNGVDYRCDVKGERRSSEEDNHPVIYISWNDADAYCKWLRKSTGKKYRLPTEAEWEYAARGGKESNGYKYSGSNNIEEVAWYDGNSGKKTHPVGTEKKPNELGIYDMSGNVWEWCSDWYDESYYKNSQESNPKGPVSSPIGSRLLRGGSWGSNSNYCRVSVRYSNVPGNNGSVIGFRVVEDF